MTHQNSPRYDLAADTFNYDSAAPQNLAALSFDVLAAGLTYEESTALAAHREHVEEYLAAAPQLAKMGTSLSSYLGAIHGEQVGVWPASLEAADGSELNVPMAAPLSAALAKADARIRQRFPRLDASGLLCE